MTAQQLKNAILQEMFLPKDNWIEKELKDIVSKRCPISYGIVQQGNHIEGGVPVVRPVDLHCKYVARDSLKCTSSDISESYSRTILRGDEILLCVRGTTGILALATKELKGCNVNRGIVPLFFDDEFDRLFFYYQLQTPTVQEAIANNTMGSALRQINIKDLRTIKLSYPPLAEQKRIVAKIEELMPKVEEYGKAQDKLNKVNEELPERLKKSILQEAIEGRLVPQDPNDEPASALLAKIREEKKQLVKEGKLKKKDLEEKPISEDEIPFSIPDSWEWVTLTQISLDSADGPFGSNLKREHYTSKKEVRIIQLSNIGENGWRDENVKYTTFSHLPSISRSEAFPNDIIIAKMMPAGRAIICPSKDKKYVLSSDAVRFDFSNHINRKFLYYAINSNVFKEQVYGEVQGITRVRTSLSKLRTYLIPLPPLAEQCRIVEKVEQLLNGIDKLKK